MPTAADLVRAIARGHLSSPRKNRVAFVASLDDRIWELVDGGPQGLLERRLSHVALNPQPLPPREAGGLLLSVLARGIIVVGGRDGAAIDAFLEDIEDWCGTGWPRRWPRPGPGPTPDPRENVDTSALLGGALAAAELAASYPAGELQELFERAAEQLTEAALR